jgi:hypothetical protein
MIGEEHPDLQPIVFSQLTDSAIEFELSPPSMIGSDSLIAQSGQ